MSVQELAEAGPWVAAALELMAIGWLLKDRGSLIGDLKAERTDNKTLRTQQTDFMVASTRENVELAKLLTEKVVADGAAGAAERAKILERLASVLERLPPRAA